MIEHTVRAGAVELAAIEAGSADRPATVLVHGYPDTKEMWTPVAERLARSFRVIAYDVRGFGSSSAPRGPLAYGFEQLAGDLEAVVDSLSPGRPVHLVGHDWGAIAGWQFAAMERFQGRLASFTSIAGPSLDQIGLALRQLAHQGQVIELVRRVYRSWYVLGLCAPGGPSVTWRGLLEGSRWAALMERHERVKPDPYFSRSSLRADGLHGANLYRRNILMRLGSRRRPASARVPVQLIVPSEDHYISECYYALAERYAPRLVRRTVEGTHWLPRARPELIADLIAGFVEEVEPG